MHVKAAYAATPHRPFFISTDFSYLPTARGRQVGFERGHRGISIPDGEVAAGMRGVPKERPLCAKGHTFRPSARNAYSIRKKDHLTT